MNEQQTQTNEKHYTVREMGELFHVSRSKLDRLAREGKIKKTKFGSTKTLQSAVYFGIIPMRLQNQPPSLETRIIYQRRRTRLLRVFLCVAHTHLKNALRVRQW